MGKANHTAKEHRWSTTAREGGEMPVVLKRWSVPTGEPDNTERVPSGSVGGWGKRSVSYLARSLPNPKPGAHWVHVEAGCPAVGLPHRGNPPQQAHPSVLDACHVPDQPGNMIGGWGGLPAYVRRGQALNGAFERLQVFLEAALDGLFKCAHR